MAIRYHIIIRTSAGGSSSKRLRDEIKKIDPQAVVFRPTWKHFHKTIAKRPHLNKGNVLIHMRAAHPRSEWMNDLIDMQNDGWSIINDPQVCKITSHAGMLKFFDVPYSIKSWVCNSRIAVGALYSHSHHEGYGHMSKFRTIMKPYYSKDQGAHVAVVFDQATEHQSVQAALNTYDDMPTSRVVVQPFIDFSSMYRVFVIGGNPMRFGTRDTVGLKSAEWKLSCCLNPDQKATVIPSALKNIAALAAGKLGSEICFVDIGIDYNGTKHIIEINTACNLNIHCEKIKATGASEANWNIYMQIARHLVKSHPLAQ